MLIALVWRVEARLQRLLPATFGSLDNLQVRDSLVIRLRSGDATAALDPCHFWTATPCC